MELVDCAHYLVVGGIELPVADVVGNRPGEEEPLLGDEGHPAAQSRLGNIANVHSADPDGPAARVKQSHQQLGERGLSRAGLANDRNP